jgi:hypothetical protein
MGLAEVRRSLSGTAGRSAGAVALATALVALQAIEMRSREIPADLLPRGHYSLSRRVFLQMLDAVPEGAALASEDAVTGWLVRTLPRPTRGRFLLREIPVEEHAVSERLATSRLFALPRGQWRLQQLGFRVSAVTGALPGLAEILPGAACSPRLTATWRSFPELTSSEHLILVANNARSRGPVYLFAWSDERPDARAIDWPAEALRGFHPRSFAMGDAEDTQSLREELQGYGADAEALIGSSPAPHVARVEMWRTPAAPLQLSVALGARPTRVVARVADAAAAHDLILCPSVPHEIEPIGGAR